MERDSRDLLMNLKTSSEINVKFIYCKYWISGFI